MSFNASNILHEIDLRVFWCLERLLTVGESVCVGWAGRIITSSGT